MYKIIVLFLVLLCGCSVVEPIEMTRYHKIEPVNYSFNDVLIIVKTVTFRGLDDKSYNYEDISNPPENEYIIDKYIDKDVTDLKEALDKYAIIQVSSEADFSRALTRLHDRKKIDHLLVCFVGEGESGSFVPFRYVFNNGTCLSGRKIKYEDWLEDINMLNAKYTCVLVGCCQAGSILKKIPKEFKGTIIASAPDGFATTPCESIGNTSFYSTIIPLIRSHHNLASCDLGSAGQAYNNFRHKWTDFWTGGGLKISYDIQRFSNSTFVP